MTRSDQPVALLLLLVFAVAPLRAGLVDDVNPFIGTSRRNEPGLHLHNGNTHPGAVRPWGMVSVLPFNIDPPASGAILGSATGYRHGRPSFSGFSHVNLSGVGGLGDLGALLLQATTGPLKFSPADLASPYGDEAASPGYYRVRLTSSNILAEATATERVGLTRFTLPAGDAHLVLNLRDSVSPTKGASLRQTGPGEFEGMRMLGGFCWQYYARQPVYFVLRLRATPDASGLWQDTHSLATGTDTVIGDAVGAFATYRQTESRVVLAKLAVSYTSIEAARANLDAELPGWDFEAVRAAARAAWSEVLSRVELPEAPPADRQLLASALYRAYLHPNLLSDVDGSYPAMATREVRRPAWNRNYVVPGTASKVRILRSERPRYTVFSLWDTYRTVHPLLSLLEPNRQTDMVRSMLGMFEESGALPKWELAANETHIMVGDPAAIVIADTWARGLRDFDSALAWRAIAASAFLRPDGSNPPTRPGLAPYLKFGYIPNDAKGPDWVWGSVSTTLEYALADFAASRFARDLGHNVEAEALLRRSREAWLRLQDPHTGFLRPRLADGSWLEPFDPVSRHGEWETKSAIGGPGYVEGNAWTYSFFVPHDIAALRDRLGAERFAALLEQCFTQNHFDPANEPDIAYPYAFNHIPGHEHQASHWVRHTIDRFYGTGPDGLPGNDDCGTLSAWLVFSMLGLYPETPGQPDYALVAPRLPRAILHLHNPASQPVRVTIRREGSDAPDARIVRITWNGTTLSRPFLNHADLVQGGELVFEMR